jgi:MFS superfamily sulfate permease-like transporter
LQFKYILGYNVPRKDTLHEQIAVLVEHGAGFNSKEFAMGMSLLALLVCLMVLSKRYPKKLFWLGSVGPMAAAIIGIVVVAVGKFNYLGKRRQAHVLLMPQCACKLLRGDI